MRFASSRSLLYLLIASMVILLTGCDALTIPGLETISTETPSPTEVQLPANITPTSAPSPAVTELPTELTLNLWVPPEFDPESGTPAGNLFKNRLSEFQNRRPNILIKTRVKEVDGPGGMINTLSAAGAAAPEALPDIIALPLKAIEPAVQKGLLYPFESIDALMGIEWFDYATELIQISPDQYSLPFAADALVLVYRPEEIPEPPLNWEELRQIQSPLLFPAADPAALFTLTQYLSTGGQIQDEDGRPMLEQSNLTAVYIFYQQASAGGQMPAWLTEFESYNQTWQEYLEGRSPYAVTWFSNYLSTRFEDTAASQIPTQNGEAYTLATGWVWALPNPDLESRLVGSELAAFLIDPEYLGDWTLAAGYLPTRPDVLNNWFNVPLQAQANNIINSAHTIPSPDILNVLAPALQETTIRVLRQEDTPSSAAEDAAEQVNMP